MKPVGAPCERDAECQFICDGVHRVCAEAEIPCSKSIVTKRNLFWSDTYVGTIEPKKCFLQRIDDTCLCQGGHGEVHADVPLSRFFDFARGSGGTTLEPKLGADQIFRCNMSWISAQSDWRDEYEDDFRDHVATCPQRLGLV